MQVQKTLIWVFCLNVVVAMAKIGVGLYSGALSMVADGLHSATDGAANIVGLIAVRIAQSPPDEEHPYGHRKAETLASLFIGILLAFAAYEILGSATRRIMDGGLPQVGVIEIGVMVVTLMVNLLTATYEHRRGQALNSEILLADAIHTRSDIGVSISVLVGLVGVRLGLVWLDAAVGLGIAVLIGYSSIQVIRKAVNVLMDRAAISPDEVAELALSMPGVESVERIRSRGPIDETYIDLHMRVDADTPIDQAHEIAHTVQSQLQSAFPQAADVTIHIEPEPMAYPDNARILRNLKAIALCMGAAIHDIWMYTLDGRYFVELHLEVPSTLDLAEAHAIATQFEEKGLANFPKVAAITTHIEPMGEIRAAAPLNEAAMAQLTDRARRFAADICGPDACHDFLLWSEQNALILSMHCSLPAHISITDAHTISERLQQSLRQRLPLLKRVTVHVEPYPDPKGLRMMP